MDESELETASTTIFGRHRSPTFQPPEVQALLQLIDKNKHVILNKATNSVANFAKDEVWALLAKEFNKRALGPERTADVLKTKWENLKRSARKVSKDVMDEECDFNKEEISKTLHILNAGSKIGENEDQNIIFKSTVGCEEGETDSKLLASNGESDNSFGGDIETQNESHKKYTQSPGFSPRDCRVLLQCVREEKNVLFSNTSLSKRQQAWKRIAESFNSQSPHKRTTKELSKKFHTLKSMARRVSVKGFFKSNRSKYDQLSEPEDIKSYTEEKIKAEPIQDCTESDSDDDVVLNRIAECESNDRVSFAQDPLNGVHGNNSDSGLGPCQNTKDAARLKLELLHYKMETARLERKRIEEAIKGDQKEREMRALEQSLRIRAARIELAAAEAKLPPSHPALRYTAEEKILY